MSHLNIFPSNIYVTFPRKMDVTVAQQSLFSSYSYYSLITLFCTLNSISPHHHHTSTPPKNPYKAASSVFHCSPALSKGMLPVFPAVLLMLRQQLQGPSATGSETLSTCPSPAQSAPFARTSRSQPVGSRLLGGLCRNWS